MESTRKFALSLLLAIPILLVLSAQAHGQGLTAEKSILDNGKDASQRSSSWWFNSGSTAVSLITAPGPALWKIPSTGNLYAAVDVPPNIVVGQLLTGINIDEYNRGCPQTVFFEAPNHAYTIQSIASGGRTSVAAVSALQGPNGCESSKENYSASIEYGRRRLGISIANPEGKILLGRATTVVLNVPPGYPVANLRIDFGAKVLLNGTTKSVFTAPADFPLGPFPLNIAVVYPGDYQSLTVRIEGVATEGTFLSSNPMFASGNGLQSVGSIVTGTNNFSVMKPPLGELVVTKRASAATVRYRTPVTYTYTVRNNTPTPVSEVNLWDNKLGEIRRIPTLASGSQIEVSSNPAELTSTTENYAMATGRDPFGNVVKGESAVVKVTVIDPALELNVWDNAVAKPGVDFQLNYTVRNRGDVTLNSITLSDAADAWTQALGIQLEPGQEFTFTRTIRVTSSTTSRRGAATAAVPADGGTVSAEDANEIELRLPELEVSITADKKAVSPGENVTYTITVSNSGDVELYNVDVTDDKFGNIAKIGILTAKNSQSFTQSEIVQRTVTHNVTANAQDQWNATLTKTAQITVDVIYPFLSVKVYANGSPSTIKVSKGEKVAFTFSVTNSGDCPITVTSVMLESQDVGGGSDIEVASGSSMNLKGVEITVDESRLYKFTVSGKDPNGKTHSWSDQVEVQVSEGLLKDLRGLIANAKALINEIERLKTRFDAVYNEYYTRLGMHINRGTDPCGDPGLSALLTEAASIHARIKDLVNQLQAILKEPLIAAAGGVEVMDIIDFATHAERTEPEVNRKLEEMRKKWSSLGCGESPRGKADLVQVQVNVVDQTGKAVGRASVSCGTGQLTTQSDGSCVFTIPLDKNDYVTATAASDIIPGYTVTGATTVVYTGGGNVELLITLNTSTQPPTTITGTVLDVNGKPLANASVSALGVEVSTSSDGTYSISGTAELEKMISITATVQTQSGERKSSGITVLFKGSPSIAAPAIVISEVEQAFEVTLSGTVVDAKGNGLSGATVSCGGFTTVTGADGSFSGLGPISTTSGKSLQVNASVGLKDGGSTSGSAVVTPSSAGTIATQIVIGGAVTEEPFTISGRVQDGNGKGLSGATVEIAGQWSGASEGDGSFTSASISVPVGTTLTLTASIKATDGKIYSGSATVTYGGGRTVSVGGISIQGIAMIDDGKSVTAVTVTTDRASIKVGETAYCSAVATFDDGSTGEITTIATWTGAENGKFTALSPGEFTVSASWKGSSGSVTIKVSCADGTDWDEKLLKCTSLESAIEETKPDDEDLCDIKLANADEKEFEKSIALGNTILEEGRTMFQFFMKKVADQNSRVCENTALASAYAGIRRLDEQYSALNDRVAVLASSILWRYGICPEPEYEQLRNSIGTIIAGFAAKHHEQFATLEGWLDQMQTELQRYGCDAQEVEELGNTIAGNTKDPNLTGDDGRREICGDGLDNDGDGLYDEDCDQQGNFNVAIILYDSGEAKDDVFGLSVSSQGALGNTPAGGARTYSLRLPPGAYVATVTVIVAPDDAGTFTIKIMDGETVLVNLSDKPVQGAIVSIPFTVSGKGGTSTFAPVEQDYETVFFNEKEVSRERLNIPDDERRQSAPDRDHLPPSQR